MSFLTPFYVLGALAVAAPIVFHLIRRAPKGEVRFSSLMFLAPSPPRLSKRSRLDQLLLLLLRATALTLLALAFARPFLRQPARLDSGEAERRRVAILVDTSASLRRGDLWTKAKALADAAIGECRPGDQLALFAFDGSTRPLLGFEESATLDPARRGDVARARLGTLSPSWAATDLGQALIDAVANIEEQADSSEKAARMPRKLVLIGDLQQGSRLDGLGDFEWPSDVELDLKTVVDEGSNASLQWLADPADSGNDPRPRVRVSNEPGSKVETFALAWLDEKGAASGAPTSAYVPPGESRVVRVPLPTGPGLRRALRLTGDSHAFDNTIYLATARKEDATVLYVGPDAADDPAGLLYYLGRVFPETPRRSVRVVAKAPSVALDLGPLRPLPLVVLATETTLENANRLKAYMNEGGTVLDVVTSPGKAETLARLAGVPAWEVEAGSVPRDVMLGEIAFEHPIFAPLAGPQFNDFTKIHFWKYRRLKSGALGDARVVARFENGDPAVVEKPVGAGRLVVLASGWNPVDSQLARSSKFVPLMAGLLEGRNAGEADLANLRVNDRVPLPAATGAGPGGKGRAVLKPDGTTVMLASGASTFAEADQPGIYTVGAGEGARAFAVNLDPAESKTAPLHVETLEQLGCRLASHARKVEDPEHLRQLRNGELEGRQKLWRWLVLAVIGVLIVETWLAGRLKRPRPAVAEVLAT